MFAGINLKTTNEFKEYKTDGELQLKRFKTITESNLRVYLKDGILDGRMIQDDWFPQIDADIFLSHSHVDEDLAKGFAGWLYKKFNLKVFVDGCIWGFCNDLLKEIDDEYCKQVSGTYDYEKRNYSTSHVHIMLATSLFKMIDKTEAVILLNTQNSISNAAGSITNKTSSPWIYSEIIATEVIRKKTLDNYRLILKKGQFMMEHASKDLKIDYNVDLKHLKQITDSHLIAWDKEYTVASNRTDALPPLDYLYKIIDPNLLKELTIAN